MAYRNHRLYLDAIAEHLYQNCPMHGEPEPEARFQYAMSLKRDFDSNAG